jgi:hypothetical protein
LGGGSSVRHVSADCFLMASNTISILSIAIQSGTGPSTKEVRGRSAKTRLGRGLVCMMLNNSSHARKVHSCAGVSRWSTAGMTFTLAGETRRQEDGRYYAEAPTAVCLNRAFNLKNGRSIKKCDALATSTINATVAANCRPL